MKEQDKREVEKLIEIEGRKFKILKFDAMTGSYVAFKLATKALPLGMGAILSEKIDNLDTSKLEMSRQEFKELQVECLRVCYEVVDGNSIPVLNDNETFRAIGLENDTKTVIGLTLQALVFNVKSFFGESIFNQVMNQFK